jgi:hypothetical protein
VLNSRVTLSILIIFTFVALSIWLLSYEEKNESTESAVTSKEELMQNTPLSVSTNTRALSSLSETPQVISEELYNEYYVEPPTVKKLVNYNLNVIRNFQAFLKANKDNLEDLPLNIRVSLNTTLQSCAGRTNIEYSEEEKTAQYFEGGSIIRLFSIDKACANVDEKLILNSYSMLESAALENPTVAATNFFRASQREYQIKKMKGGGAPENIEELKRQHVENSLPLLIESAAKGSLHAAFTLGTEYTSRSRRHLLEPDPIKSLTYLMAVNSADNSLGLQKTITQQGDKLYPYEVVIAKKKAKDLIDGWNQLEHLTY